MRKSRSTGDSGNKYTCSLAQPSGGQLLMTWSQIVVWQLSKKNLVLGQVTSQVELGLRCEKLRQNTLIPEGLNTLYKVNMYVMLITLNQPFLDKSRLVQQISESTRVLQHIFCQVVQNLELEGSLHITIGIMTWASSGLISWQFVLHYHVSGQPQYSALTDLTVRLGK